MILFIASTLLLRSCVASILLTSVSSSHCAVSTLTSCAACRRKRRENGESVHSVKVSSVKVSGIRCEEFYVEVWIFRYQYSSTMVH